MAAALPCDRTKRTILARPSMCRSLQIPRSAGEIRPSAVTAVASVMVSAAPPAARDPRCTRCQSFANPSSLEYSHMGETKTRLASVTPLSVIGSNRCGMATILARKRRRVTLRYRPLLGHVGGGVRPPPACASFFHVFGICVMTPFEKIEERSAVRAVVLAVLVLFTPAVGLAQTAAQEPPARPQGVNTSPFLGGVP